MPSNLRCALLAASLLCATHTLAATPGVRPGPDILYRAPATSPQLSNVGIWRAAPILISGVSAYRSGEFLYQDYLFDDRGAGQRALYPADLKAKTADNAADFVEVRIKPLAAATAVRVTYNTLIDPNVVGTTIALGDAAPAAAIPFGAGGVMPATVFITVHGRAGEITDAATGKSLGKAAVKVDLARRQIEIQAPYAVFDPRGQGAVRVAVATGLWDAANNRYLAPADPPAPPPPEPGAVAPRNRPPLAALPAGRSLFFNVAFRYHEPLNTGSLLPYFSDVAQADALWRGDLSAFYATVDFKKLASGRDDNSGLPTKGFMSRILVSHFEPAQGRGSATRLGPGCANPCIPQFASRLQPYEIYIPAKTPPAAGYGLTVDLHSADASYARWLGHPRHVEFGERGPGSIVITPNGRGLRGGYYSESGADVFEVWADVARRYKIDNDYVSLAGVSMGAMGSFKFGAQFPDLFAAIAVSVGCPSEPGLVGLREIPVMLHSGDVDTTTECHPRNKALQHYLATNDQYQWWNFLNHPHPFSSRPKTWQAFADFLGLKRRAPDPARVTYAVDQQKNQSTFGLNSDHAYWLSGVTVRDMNHQTPRDPKDPVSTVSSYGIIDVKSEGFGQGDPERQPVVKGSGVYTFGVPDYPWPNYDSQTSVRGPIPKTPIRDVLNVKAENIASVVIDPKRAKVSCAAKLNIDSDGPIKVTLAGCPAR